MNVRKAELADVPQMVALSAAKRREYEQYQPVFWRVAPEADDRQGRFFEYLVQDPQVISLVYEQDGRAMGFLIATVRPAPPVYNPGGPSALIDDFTVANDDWTGIGARLLDHAARTCRERGAVQLVVISPHLEQPKRTFLRAHGYAVAAEWYLKPLAEPEAT